MTKPLVARTENLNNLHLSQGVRDSLPIILGIIPFGITCGLMGITTGLTQAETILMSVLVFAGASQFVSMTMLGAGITEWSIIVFTTLLVNLRHIIMGASLAPYMMKLPLPLQAVLSFGLVDESYALTANRIYKDGYSAYYQLGASAALYLSWILSTVIGVMMGGYLARCLEWGLDFAMIATFLVLLIPRLVDRISIVVCALSGIIAVVGALYLPGKWYIIVACLLASVVGSIMERRNKGEN
ncbi:AzlC family ABC transporter permease [Desulforamulus ferrireducens]|uniref:Branched-chain amino acid transporter AzlC n=1 Tax=Desulforamulus ferrireducens TaxID=1833852 RepID=A0A1S6IWQ4_9FIRM|nr:AzlC family ABC transporter permease [Desulforamulus ferrireducens]AQS59198.1 branched-chain amino acid transporter AzlC [Desulforamulus ferrireducens]